MGEKQVYKDGKFYTKGNTVFTVQTVIEPDRPSYQRTRIIAEVTGRLYEVDRQEMESVAAKFAAVDDLIAALNFYVGICGNTAYAVSRETAAEMYDVATKALAKARG